MFKNKKIIGIISVLVLSVAAWFAFGFFGIHKAFLDDEVSEDGPIFASGAEIDQSEDSVDESTPDEPVNDVETTSAPAVQTSATGSFSGLKNYSVSGIANVLTDGNQSFLRFEEDFSASNGPDLKVYLRSEGGEFVNLGNLKGNIGSQNYEIDSSVDLDVFNKVEIWCERFSVGFGSATLKG